MKKLSTIPKWEGLGGYVWNPGFVSLPAAGRYKPWHPGVFRMSGNDWTYLEKSEEKKKWREGDFWADKRMPYPILFAGVRKWKKGMGLRRFLESDGASNERKSAEAVDLTRFVGRPFDAVEVRARKWREGKELRKISELEGRAEGAGLDGNRSNTDSY